MTQGDPALSLALSPLLQPLRFATRAGVGRLTGLEALVAKVVEQARAYATDAAAGRLERLAQTVRGFDEASEQDRQRAVASLVGQSASVSSMSTYGSNPASPARTAGAKRDLCHSAAIPPKRAWLRASGR